MRNVADIGKYCLFNDYSFIWAFFFTSGCYGIVLIFYYDFLTGLHILYSLLKSLEQETAVQSFYKTYYMMIVQHVLSVVTDTSHTAGNYRSPKKK